MALYPQHDHEYIVFCDMFLLCRIVTEASPQNVSMCILTRPFSMYTQICVRTICTCSEAPYTIRISIHHQIQEKRYPYVYVGNMAGDQTRLTGELGEFVLMEAQDWHTNFECVSIFEPFEERKQHSF